MDQESRRDLLAQLMALAQVTAMPLSALLSLIAGFAAVLLIFVMLLGFMLGSPWFGIWCAFALVIAIINALDAVPAIAQPCLAALGRYGLLSALVLIGAWLVWFD